MQAGPKKVLRGLLISKFGDQGPEPISWYPNNDFNSVMLTEISIKAVSILAGDEGVLSSEYLSILPIPKFHIAAVIYVFKIPDPKARGGEFVGTASILFDIKFMPVIYSTMEDLERLISPIDSFIVKPLIENADISTTVKTFYDSIEEFINNRHEEEITRYQIADKEISKYDEIYSFKVVVVGDPSVGKTTLVLRYVERAFRELYIPTIGVQVSLKKMELDNIAVKFNLWDIAGQDLFSQVRDKFYDGSQAVIILYDITNPKSFGNVVNWHADVRRVLGNIPGFIIGNKLDLPRKISRIDGSELAKKLNLQFTETSAKNGINIDFVFEQLAKSLIKK